MSNRHYEPVRPDLQEKKRFKRPGSTSFTAVQEVREWLQASIKNHWFFYEQDGKLWIAFCCKQDALLWKLTWH